VDDLEGYYADLTGQDSCEVGDRVEQFAEDWTEEPERFIGPITSIGLNVAGILAAFVLILITAYYMAVRLQPLVDGLVRLGPPSRRDHVRHVLDRLRRAWTGWMQGVGWDMLVTGVLVFIALTLIGLEFAIFLAILLALLVVVPYFGGDCGRRAAGTARAHPLSLHGPARAHTSR
jgi:predicted PurR-regulated permease PerM